MSKKLRTFTRRSYISDTIPMERFEIFHVKNGRGIVIERWEVKECKRGDDDARFFIAEIEELHPFYN